MSTQFFYKRVLDDCISLSWTAYPAKPCKTVCIKYNIIFDVQLSELHFTILRRLAPP